MACGSATEIPKKVKAGGRAWRKINTPKGTRPAGTNAGKPGILAALPFQHLLMNRRLHPLTLQQAAEDSPTLASLMARARDASERLQAIQELIPPEMRSAVQAGPVDGNSWCLLVRGSAAAAKLRQLVPALQARLKSKGWADVTLRLKVLTRH